MDGLFLENGPFRLEMDENENYQIKAAEHSWHKSPAYTLYIDQPVGTGLSFTTSGHYPSNDELVNVDFYHFIQSFFQLHSDKFVDHRVRNPLWFSGESHAGHYIPSMMNYILKQNDDLKDGDIEIPLAGAAIGNGWTGTPIFGHY
jgi:carboxypeptidase D